MKATCDICGKQSGSVESLVSEYATEQVNDVCRECLKILKTHLDDIRKLQHKILFSWMKRFIDNLRGKLYE